MAMPSKVAVPRPSSSRITSERAVACLRMSEVSSSSTRKVERPAMMASFAPTRVKMRSTGESEHASAATQQPRCAISTVRHACRSTVDLPPMFGPVTSRKRAASPSPPPPAPSGAGPIRMSLGMHCPSDSADCTHRLTPCLMCRKGSASATKAGRHIPAALLARASERRQSSSAAHETALRQMAYCAEKRAKSCLAAAARAASSAAFASRCSPASSRSSAVQKRLVPFLDDICCANSSGVPCFCSVFSATASWKGSVVCPLATEGVHSSMDESRSSRRQRDSSCCRPASTSSSRRLAASYSSLARSLGTTLPALRAASQSNASRKGASVASTGGKPASASRERSPPSRGDEPLSPGTCGCTASTAASRAARPASALRNSSSLALDTSV
mmetsp:Transcript_22144/g.72271  ORF Transcript_22144/g.72271 Transcript_22144/m.72271 type:complete len:388 (+) Transcript_22144:609-1772(+)